MKKFTIFKPDSFSWTTTSVSYIYIAGIVMSILVLKFLLHVPDFHPIYKYLLYATLLPFFYRIICSVLVVNKYRPLKGKLEGDLVFDKDSIAVDKDTYLLKDISHIVIEGNDWLGAEKSHRSFSNYFENILSQGVDNTATINLLDGRIVKTKFQKLCACELKEVEDVFLHYYLNNKITSTQIAENLCLSVEERERILKRMKLQQIAG
ncbi:hypothetical protein [Pontibacter mangrovi]|uniref:Uncharacterized protein n=1 Tax=Pontibacter mangrovi TaxID=2589816 RepID=A0A501VZT1_9BACT|nr:hypothetical protein [Pontibacter mangrovi]TPE43233.1 hypothetical protein FJM65_14055 [Pontibacter mangrovi]